MPDHLDPSYITLLKDQITHVERHGVGIDDELLGPVLLPSSIEPPTAHWTSDEKRLFFHGLARHSRLRPDLIAESIGSKSSVEVCTYIQVLDRLARTQPKTLDRAKFPAAREMDASWERFEESQTTSLSSLQLKRGRQNDAETQEGERSVRDKRRRITTELSSQHITSLEQVLRYISETESNEDDLDEDPTSYMLQRAISNLGDINLDLKTLQQDGVSVLRPVKVQKLMRFYFRHCRSIDTHGPEKHRHPRSSLTYSLLRALVLLLRRFLRQAIMHTISCAESHKNTRIPTYLFGNNNAITTAHVESALSSTNLEISKSQFFESLVDRIGQYMEQASQSTPTDEGVGDPTIETADLSDTSAGDFVSEILSRVDDSDLISFPQCLLSSTAIPENLDDEIAWEAMMQEEDDIDAEDSRLDFEQQEEAWNNCSSTVRKKRWTFLSRTYISEDDEVGDDADETVEERTTSPSVDSRSDVDEDEDG